MKKHALGALFLGLMACGGGGGSDTTVTIQPDSNTGGDSQAPTCNPLTQTGCNAGEKCTWINDQDDPPIGHVGCAPEAAAPKAIGEACTPPPGGPMGYDDCAKGAVCLSGECKQICDLNGGTPTCDDNHSCTRYADFFESGGNAVAGVCDPGCDPLTQELKVGTNKAACGSPDPAAPNSGCYGYEDYSCAPVSAQVLSLTDRMMPRTNAAGNPYLNGCAPGFIPLFYQETGSTVTLCTGLCAALEIDSTEPGNFAGDSTALGKDPTVAAPAAGSATCSAIHRGSSANSSCRFIWYYLEDDQQMLPPVFENSGYLDTLGVCFDYTKFTYDNDGNTMTANITVPSCKELPKRTAMTTGDDDDAADWGCQKRSNSQFAAGEKHAPGALKALVNLPKHEAMELVRHTFN